MSNEQPCGATVETPPIEKNWVTVASADELADGRSKAIEAGGRDIALFRSGEEYYAVENQCPHYGAPLCGGHVRGTTLTCAWHGWQFALESGECISAPGCDVETYEVKIEDGQVKIAVG
jgi:NAD(P)H-dependent nitrite reductase small subunit